MQQSYTVSLNDNGGKYLAYSKERHTVPQSRIAHVITTRAEMADLITLQLPEKDSSTEGERRLLIFLAEAGLNGVDREVFFQKCDEYLGGDVCNFIKLISLGYIKSDGNRFFI